MGQDFSVGTIIICEKNEGGEYGNTKRREEELWIQINT